jgi:hypothetical protein
MPRLALTASSRFLDLPGAASGSSGRMTDMFLTPYGGCCHELFAGKEHAIRQVLGLAEAIG